MRNTPLRVGIAVLMLQFFLPALSASQNDTNGLVVFGDSLSDTGNKYAITGFANTPPYSELLEFFLVADGPYTRGGLHHSNGATWIEQYARPLGQAGYVRPALRSQGTARNYAYGGARARLEPVIIPNANQHLPTQVTNFLADVNNMAPSDALYMLFIGGNDIFDAVFALSSDPSGATSEAVLNNAVTSVATQVARLSFYGARHLVVLNAPDLGLTPAVGIADAIFSSSNPAINPGDVIAAATQFSILYNAGLNAALGSVPGVQIIDIFTEFQNLVSNPQDFGLTNSTHACVTPDQPPYACKKPDEFVFWDGVHPTKVTHSIIADVVSNALTP
jgi:phospholipase/lecithinase/hemolysin